jgi:hypothetical protein
VPASRSGLEERFTAEIAEDAERIPKQGNDEQRTENEKRKTD